ncbi:MAG: class I SAM-dependent methyltransferase [Anaerolineae bacterium]|nr:class I SAM-dependent methyltransferase [Anaerolineae bacterium]
MNLKRGLTEEIRRAEAVAQGKDSKFETNYATRYMFAWQNQLILNALSAKTGPLLEIGAGIGNFLVDAVTNVKDIHATEVGANTARIAQTRTPTVNSISLAPAEHLPFKSNSFETIVARGVLHHLEDPTKGIEEMYRVLHPGGRLIVFEGNPASTYRKLVLSIADQFGIEHEVSQYEHLLPAEIRRLLARFTQVECKSVSGFLAPISYAGLGGPVLWKTLQSLQDVLYRWRPDGFSWWLLWTAQK